MNVLSLFDGISCGQIALQRAGIPVDLYFASEINANCIKVTQHHYPNTIQLGDVTNIKKETLPKIDLVIGGSPCQGFSYVGKGLNFNDPRSALFFEFVRLIEELKPKYWLLENVVMKKEFENVINQYLGVSPVKINSDLVSGQNRNRLYWSNFLITPPEDKKIKLTDILEDQTLHIPAAVKGLRINSKMIREDSNRSLPIVYCLQVKTTNQNKSNCITTVEKDNVLTFLTSGRYPNAFKKPHLFRYYTITEYCRLQTLPDNYFNNLVSNHQAAAMIGNAWTVDVIAHILSLLPS